MDWVIFMAHIQLLQRKSLDDTLDIIDAVDLILKDFNAVKVWQIGIVETWYEFPAGGAIIGHFSPDRGHNFQYKVQLPSGEFAIKPADAVLFYVGFSDYGVGSFYSLLNKSFLRLE